MFSRLLTKTRAISSPVILPLDSLNIRTLAASTARSSIGLVQIALSFVSTTHPRWPLRSNSAFVPDDFFDFLVIPAVVLCQQFDRIASLVAL